ncbi:MAG: glycosyltransferase [Phycisphaerales bacterium]
MTASRRIIIHAFGSAGDVRPLAAVGGALARRGHAVTLTGNAHDRHLGEELGLPFIPVGEAWDRSELARDPSLLHPVGGSAGLLQKVILPRIGATFADLRSLIRDSAEPVDLLVGHHTSFGVPWVAEEFGIPWAMAAVAPASWPSIENPSVYPGMPDRDSYRRPLLRAGMAAGRWYTNRMIDPALSAIRRSLGLPAIRSAMFDSMFSGVANLGLWPALFRAPAGDDPARTVSVGFPRWPRGGRTHTLPESIERFLEQRDGAGGVGAPVVAITLGTTAIHQGAAIIEAALIACGRLGARCIVLGGDASVVDGHGHAMHAAWAEHDALLGRVDAVVHHAGIGTTASSLRAGTPAVAVPFTHDQPDNARRSRLLGASVTVVRKRASQPEALGAAIGDVLRSDSMRSRCAEISARLADEDGAEAGADHLERVMGWREEAPAFAVSRREPAGMA